MKETAVKGRSNFGPKGWLLVILCLLGAFCSAACSGSLNVSSGYFTELYGWTQTQLMWGTTFGSLVGAALAFFGGRLFLKRSPRKVIFVCCILYAIFFILNGFSVRLWMFYLTMIGVVACGFIWAMICNATLIANWFPRKRGLAMGWVTMGMPLGSGIAANVMRVVYVRAGFHVAYIPYAALAIVVGIIAMAALRDFPSECGCYPDNDKNFDMEKLKAEEAEIQRIRSSSPWTAKRIFTSKEFWLLVLAISIMMFATGFIPQVVVTLVSYGFSVDVATYAMLVVCLIACFGSWLMGKLDIRFGTKSALIILICCSIFMGLIAMVNTLGTKLVAFAFVGIIMGGGSNFMLSMMMDLWGQKSCMNVYRYGQPISTAISSFGSTILAAIAALAGGNYNYAFLFVGLCSVIALIMVIFVRKDNVKKKEEKFLEQS